MMEIGKSLLVRIRQWAFIEGESRKFFLRIIGTPERVLILQNIIWHMNLFFLDLLD